MLKIIGNKKRVIMIKIFSILSIILLVINGQSQTTLSLDRAIIIGLENNFQIRISQEQYNIAELNNKWGTVGRFPSIGLGVSSVNRYDNTPMFDTSAFEYDRGDQYSNSLTPYANLQWLLFDGLSVNMNKKKLDMLESYSLGYSTIVVENTIQAIILG